MRKALIVTAAILCSIWNADADGLANHVWWYYRGNVFSRSRVPQTHTLPNGGSVNVRTLSEKQLNGYGLYGVVTTWTNRIESVAKPKQICVAESLVTNLAAKISIDVTQTPLLVHAAIAGYQHELMSSAVQDIPKPLIQTVLLRDLVDDLLQWHNATTLGDPGVRLGFSDKLLVRRQSFKTLQDWQGHDVTKAITSKHIL